MAATAVAVALRAARRIHLRAGAWLRWPVNCRRRGVLLRSTRAIAARERYQSLHLVHSLPKRDVKVAELAKRTPIRKPALQDTHTMAQCYREGGGKAGECRTLRCATCAKEFVLTAGEVQFLQRKHGAHDYRQPSHCLSCRKGGASGGARRW